MQTGGGMAGGGSLSNRVGYAYSVSLLPVPVLDVAVLIKGSTPDWMQTFCESDLPKGIIEGSGANIGRHNIVYNAETGIVFIGEDLQYSVDRENVLLFDHGDDPKNAPQLVGKTQISIEGSAVDLTRPDSVHLAIANLALVVQKALVESPVLCSYADS